MSADNPYSILGLKKKTATDAEIKAAYRRQVTANHPDKHTDKSEVERNAYAQQFQRATWAYDILRDPQSRAYFDRHGRVRSKIDLNQLNAVDQSLIACFRDVVQKTRDLRSTDLVYQMRLAITDRLEEVRAEIARLKDNCKEYPQLLDRFLRDDDAQNVIAESIRHDMTTMESLIEVRQERADHLKACLNELQHWTYLTDQARRDRVPVAAISYTS